MTKKVTQNNREASSSTAKGNRFNCLFFKVSSCNIVTQSQIAEYPSWLHNERIRAVCRGDIWKKSFFWHLLGLHSPLQSVGEKQLTENKDEHLSLAGPRGGNKAAIAATALRKEIAFPSLSFVHTLDALSHNSSGKQEGITDRIGCVTQNSSSPIMQ